MPRTSSRRIHWVVGIDLSGPANPQGTCGAVFKLHGHELVFTRMITPASDKAIMDMVVELAGQFTVGIDAPLSYEDGGKQRKRDKLLRELLKRQGVQHVGVMAPTFNRMVYLTLRGMGLARQIEMCRQAEGCNIVEVHPGSALALRGADPDWLAGYKPRGAGSPGRAARQRRLRCCAALGVFLGSQCVVDLPINSLRVDHEVDACAAAVACRDWLLGKPLWREPRSPPQHPYDFVC